MFFIGIILWANSIKIKNSKKEDCGKADVSNGQCTLWNNNECWKGTCKGDYSKGLCECHRKNTGSRVLLGISIALLSLSIYFLVQGFRHKNSNTAMGFRFY